MKRKKGMRIVCIREAVAAFICISINLNGTECVCMFFYSVVRLTFIHKNLRIICIHFIRNLNTTARQQRINKKQKNFIYLFCCRNFMRFLIENLVALVVVCFHQQLIWTLFLVLRTEPIWISISFFFSCKRVFYLNCLLHISCTTHSRLWCTEFNARTEDNARQRNKNYRNSRINNTAVEAATPRLTEMTENTPSHTKTNATTDCLDALSNTV